MKIQINTQIGVVDGNNAPNNIFDEVINCRQDNLDPNSFQFDNLILRTINYTAPTAGPLSIATILGLSDLTHLVSINIFLKTLPADCTTETQPLQFAYAVATGAGSVSMGNISQLQLTGLSSSAIIDITLSTLPCAANTTTVLSIIATTSN